MVMMIIMIEDGDDDYNDDVHNYGRMVDNGRDECRVASNENYHHHQLEDYIDQDVYRSLQPVMEKWIGNKIRLAGTACYGLRRYHSFGRSQ